MALNPSIQFNFRSRQLLLRSAHPEGRTRRHFLSVPHSWGTRDLANLTAICNLQYEYNNIFIKVLQGHPGKNQTTTREESCGALAHPQQLAFLGHHSSQCGAHRWRSAGNPQEGPGEEALGAKKISTLARQDQEQEEARQEMGRRRTPGVAFLGVQSRPLHPSGRRRHPQPRAPQPAGALREPCSECDPCVGATQGDRPWCDLRHRGPR